jgi:hypothetical protein
LSEKHVVIDGVTYAPVSESNPSAEHIARGIMEGFWGNIPSWANWEDEANSLRVHCGDCHGNDMPTVMDVVNEVLRYMREGAKK